MLSRGRHLSKKIYSAQIFAAVNISNYVPFGTTKIRSQSQPYPTKFTVFENYCLPKCLLSLCLCRLRRSWALYSHTSQWKVSLVTTPSCASVIDNWSPTRTRVIARDKVPASMVRHHSELGSHLVTLLVPQ